MKIIFLYLFLSITSFDFTGSTITGDLSRPDQEYIEARRLSKLNSLIQYREEWKKKIADSVNEL